MDRRPTQSDVAKAAGVHRATVSLVFSNHPSIPAKTKERVMKCAKELGYSPDPMLSALAVYRTNHRPPAFHGTLAWLTNHPFGEESWRGIATYRDYYEGALSCAKTHGYNLEIFDFRKSAPSSERLATIFRSRNIQGILLPPQQSLNVKLNFPWEQFSAVTFGHSLIYPQLHAVGSAQFRSMVQLIRHLKQLGYKRIGYYSFTDFDERTDHNYLAGYLVEVYTPRKTIIPPFAANFSLEQFKKWYEKYRPDAIISGNGKVLDLLDSMGIQVPGDLGIAAPHLVERNSRLSGMCENAFHVGEVAADYLVNMINQGRHGIPKNPQRIYVECEWNPGETLRQIA